MSDDRLRRALDRNPQGLSLIVVRRHHLGDRVEGLAANLGRAVQQCITLQPDASASCEQRHLHRIADRGPGLWERCAITE